MVTAHSGKSSLASIAKFLGTHLYSDPAGSALNKPDPVGDLAIY